jgi:hypothetical protein
MRKYTVHDRCDGDYGFLGMSVLAAVAWKSEGISNWGF